LRELSDQISQVAGHSQKPDPLLDKALAYYYHAQFLWTEREKITDLTSFHAKLVVAETILNCYKAVAVILIRNEYDVAHSGRDENASRCDGQFCC
jgi:hypothetical protein